jgi:hypothetical protein
MLHSKVTERWYNGCDINRFLWEVLHMQPFICCVRDYNRSLLALLAQTSDLQLWHSMLLLFKSQEPALALMSFYYCM